MYKGYNVDFNISSNDLMKWKAKGKELYANSLAEIQPSLKNYISIDGRLDGATMQEDWFPQVNADIFLSHSHRDEDKAMAFAGWLYYCFGLKAFIDSQIWGYSNDLLKEIDKKYCYKPESRTYDYDLRNESTSHVHMMLLVALTKMMDKTECLFFLNTENSITVSETIQKTKSPWIFSEIALSQIVRKQDISRKKTVKLFESGGEIQKAFSSIPLDHSVDTRHLLKLSIHDLNEWENLFSNNQKNNTYPKYPLDLLYSIK